MKSVITEAQLSELEERAKKVREKFPLTEEITPIVVEFAGSPKSGKSTNIDSIAHFFKRMGFKTWYSTEGASKRTPYHLRRDLVAYNTWTLSYAVTNLLESYFNIDTYEIIILDRGLFDSLAWFSLLRNRGELSEKDLTNNRNFALQWSRLISRLYLFTCTPEVSLEREHRTKLTRQRGTAMNEEMLSSLLIEYKALRDELRSYPIMAIETSNTTDPLESSYEIAKDIISLLESQDEQKGQ